MGIFGSLYVYFKGYGLFGTPLYKPPSYLEAWTDICTSIIILQIVNKNSQQEFNPYTAIKFLSPKCCLLFTSAAYIQVQYRLDSFMEVNSMNLDHTAPWERSNLVPYCT